MVGPVHEPVGALRDLHGGFPGGAVEPRELQGVPAGGHRLDPHQVGAAVGGRRQGIHPAVGSGGCRQQLHGPLGAESEPGPHDEGGYSEESGSHGVIVAQVPAACVCVEMTHHRAARYDRP